MKVEGRFRSNHRAVVVAILLFGSGLLRPISHPLVSQIPQKVSPVAPASPAKPAVTGSLAPSGQHALTAEDVEAFTDGMLPIQLKREDIAGAVIIVVKDGKVLFQKGYGYSDVASRKPVTPDGTLFRPGSVSKLFTWTAVMQQVEQGKIDLDRDINDYLDFKIPATYPKPITMRNLMTHTAGFEEAIKDLIVTKGSATPTVGDYLKTHMPQRVYPPGVTPAYSNYGATLAGYIVERVSGMPFDDYVEKNIFTPLDMGHTSFRQPLPAQLQPLMSKGYGVGSGEPKPYEIVAAAPAGSSATSAVDISHFMIAHLQNGEYNGVRILKPETAALMHSPQFGVNPNLPRMCLGFYEQTRDGQRTIEHGGDTQFFHSDLVLIPAANIGLFVSVNSLGRGEADVRGPLVNAFLDRYFPYTVPASKAPATAASDAEMVAGQYISSRSPVTSILAFFGVVGETKVSAGEGGSITISDMKGLNQVPKTWQEIGPLLYREKDGQNEVGFSRDADHRLVLATDYPFMIATRVSLLDSKSFNMFLLYFFSTVFLLTLVVWPLSAWIRLHYHRPLLLTPQQSRLRLAVRFICAVDLAFVLCWVILLASAGGEPLFDSHLDPVLRIFQVIGWVGSLGTLVVLYAFFEQWRRPGEWWLARLGNAAVVLAAIAFSWFLLHWHLLHLSMVY